MLKISLSKKRRIALDDKSLTELNPNDQAFMGQISLFWLTGDLHIYADPMVARILDFHLQVEQSLVELIKSFLKDAEQVKTDNLSFPAKVSWARALAGPQDKDEIWTLALKLNELRNSVAHRTSRAPLSAHEDMDRVRVCTAHSVGSEPCSRRIDPFGL